MRHAILAPTENLMSPSNLPRLALSVLNLFPTGVGHFGPNMTRWVLVTTAMQYINAKRLNLQATSSGLVPNSNHAMYKKDFFFCILIPSTG